ncbi:acyltransferase [Celeribacter indicus]|uniref:dTDP-glucose 4,6-dehydratase n=1 Tax=Celeribacter indicus TaxID=1208324 RepID=A0A0B5DQQ0_9RHOB|nr:acyltransferase [Celeribacter indicus]AJE45424.1 dTDP-glucose 4,6-dehydratase [Celeribacter indicus]SDX01650.1 Acetyltransferase (isoleucine patch superfamily) [Celeribacter indicus]
MLAFLIKSLTGRDYSLRSSDLGYLAGKALGPGLRGLWRYGLWRGRLVFIGRGVVMISRGRLDLGRGASIGHFSYIDASSREGVRIAAGATLREYCWIQCRSGLNAIGEGLEIGERAYVGPFSSIGVGGKVVIGAGTQIGAGLRLSAEAHELGSDHTFTDGTVRRAGIEIGRNVWMGNSVTILDGVTIGDGAVIGAGAVVTRSIGAGMVAFGAPAREVRPVAPVSPLPDKEMSA